MLELSYLYDEEPYSDGFARIYPTFPHPALIAHMDKILLYAGLRYVNGSISLNHGHQTVITAPPVDEAQEYNDIILANWSLVCTRSPFRAASAGEAASQAVAPLLRALKDMKFLDGKWSLALTRMSHKDENIWPSMVLTNNPTKHILAMIDWTNARRKY